MALHCIWIKTDGFISDSAHAISIFDIAYIWYQARWVMGMYDKILVLSGIVVWVNIVQSSWSGFTAHHHYLQFIMLFDSIPCWLIYYIAELCI